MCFPIAMIIGPCDMLPPGRLVNSDCTGTVELRKLFSFQTDRDYVLRSDQEPEPSHVKISFLMFLKNNMVDIGQLQGMR